MGAGGGAKGSTANAGQVTAKQRTKPKANRLKALDYISALRQIGFAYKTSRRGVAHSGPPFGSKVVLCGHLPGGC